MISAWFAGPKAENSPWFNTWLGRIADDYAAWRRNYFPEDGVVVDSSLRRHNEPFMDAFEDRLLELLARLKADVPFHSLRYAAHMLAEQTLPAVAGYFAAMLYNPNNVAADVAPVTVKLELEAGRLLSRMIGYGDESWAHLCSGGTSANIEAMWAARAVKYLPLVVRDVRRAVGLPGVETATSDRALLGMAPMAALEGYFGLWREVKASRGSESERLARVAHEACRSSAFNVGERGVAAVCGALGSSPVLFVPETHHYCFEKCLDLLGLGRGALRSVPVDGRFRMRADELERGLTLAEKNGEHVLAVVAVVGSTEVGSVDPVDKIVEVRRARERAGRPSFWLHVDGAYGGYLRTVTIPRRVGLGEPSVVTRVGGVERRVELQLPEHEECAALEQMHVADSVTIDPHKLGYIPYPAGAICFRSDMVRPHMRQIAPYVDDAPPDPEGDRRSGAIGLYVLEGSKPGAAAAAVWLSHTLIPLDTSGHGRLIRENIRNACELHALLERGWEERATRACASVRAVCLCPPGSNIVCYAFRPVRERVSLAEINRLNRGLFDRFNLEAGEKAVEKPFFVSRTSLSARQYSAATVGGFLERLGVRADEYEAEGVFLLRSVLMNPWYGYAKRRERYFLAEMAEELFAASAGLAEVSREAAQG